MKIFLDSADVDEIIKAYEYGVVDGVTTNPGLLKIAIENSKTKIDLEIYIRTILKTAKGTPVSIEVTETEATKMVEQGKKLFKFFNHTAKNVVIKIPVNTAFDESGNQFEGLKAIRLLAKEKIPINATLIETPEQALLAAKAGAKYVSPFVGRIDNLIRDQNKIKYEKSDYFPAQGNKDLDYPDDNGIVSGVDLVAKCVEILKVHKYHNVEVIASSIRNARQARECALAGAHIATIPFSVITALTIHKKTYEGMKMFSEAAAAVPEFANMK